MITASVKTEPYGYSRLKQHTLELCARIGVNYDDVQQLESKNDQDTFDKIVIVTMKSGERKEYRL